MTYMVEIKSGNEVGHVLSSPVRQLVSSNVVPVVTLCGKVFLCVFELVAIQDTTSGGLLTQELKH